MTAKEKREKAGWFIFMLGYFALGYAVTSRISQASPAFVDVSMGFESGIPFVPEFIFGYLLVFASVLVAFFAIDDYTEWMRTVRAFLITTTAAYLLFLAVPVRMELRPDVIEAAGLAGWATRLYFAIDPPYNCFPSLHVTYPALATILLWRGHKRARWVLMAMALTVSVSVVLVKQHYIADIFAGFVNAAMAYALALGYERVKILRKEVQPGHALN